MSTVKLISEIGINHNGSVELAKKLIDISKFAGFDYVKFQKRTPEICVPESQKDVLRKTPWGEMKYIDYKRKIEFGEKEYDEIFKYCEQLGIGCFASVWDVEAVDFMAKYTDIAKIGSATMTDTETVKLARKRNNILILSTGMSTEKEITNAVYLSDPDVIMHTNSTYPCPVDELNLGYITYLKDKWADSMPKAEIGYSGHEFGLATTFASVAMGATWIERHITIDRTMWGSDQMSSVEPTGMIKLVKGIRDIEKAMVGNCPREVSVGELPKYKSLRKVK